MKRFLMVAAICTVPFSPANAWYDSYGGFTCGYMDPLTSFLDSIFGPPCPSPAAVPVQAVPAPVAVAPQPVPVPAPVPMPVPVPRATPYGPAGVIPGGPTGWGGMAGPAIPGIGYIGNYF